MPKGLTALQPLLKDHDHDQPPTEPALAAALVGDGILQKPPLVFARCDCDGDGILQKPIPGLAAEGDGARMNTPAEGDGARVGQGPSGKPPPAEVFEALEPLLSPPMLSSSGVSGVRDPEPSSLLPQSLPIRAREQLLASPETDGALAIIAGEGAGAGESALHNEAMSAVVAGATGVPQPLGLRAIAEAVGVCSVVASGVSPLAAAVGVAMEKEATFVLISILQIIMFMFMASLPKKSYEKSRKILCCRFTDC